MRKNGLKSGVDLSGYTSSFYEFPEDGYLMYSGGANVGTGSCIRLSGPEKNYSGAMRLFCITPVNGQGSCVATFVRKGMSLRVESCTGGAYIYYRELI